MINPYQYEQDTLIYFQFGELINAMKKNDREFDTYYDDEEDITGPVEDTFYDSFSGARHKVKVIVICRFRENNQLLKPTKNIEPPPPEPRTHRRSAKYTVVGMFVGVLLFLTGVGCGFLLGKIENDPPNGKGFIKIPS